MEPTLLPTLIVLTNLTKFVDNIIVYGNFNSIALVYEHKTIDVANALVLAAIKNVDINWILLCMDEPFSMDEEQHNYEETRELFSNPFLLKIIIIEYGTNVSDKLNETQQLYRFSRVVKTMLIMVGGDESSIRKNRSYEMDSIKEIVIFRRMWSIILVHYFWLQQQPQQSIPKMDLFNFKSVYLTEHKFMSFEQNYDGKMDPVTYNSLIFYDKTLDIVNETIYVYVLMQPPRVVNLTRHKCKGSCIELFVGGNDAYLSSLIDHSLKTKSRFFTIKHSALLKEDEYNTSAGSILRDIEEISYPIDYYDNLNQIPYFILYNNSDLFLKK